MSLSIVSLSLFAAALSASPSSSAPQDKPASGAVHRLEITNGGTRTVHLVGRDVSKTDQRLLRDVSRAESDVALANGLQRLRASYLDDESRMARQRFETNYRQAGITHAYNPGIYPDMVPVVDARILYESDYGWGYRYGVAGWGGYPGYGFGGYYPQATGAGSMYADSMIPPSPLQTELAKSLAARATPEFAEQAQRNYRAALTRANESEVIAKALDKPASDIQPVAAEAAREFVLKNKDVVVGTLVQRDPDWMILDTDAGRVEVRTSEVALIRPKK